MTVIFRTLSSLFSINQFREKLRATGRSQGSLGGHRKVSGGLFGGLLEFCLGSLGGLRGLLEISGRSLGDLGSQRSQIKEIIKKIQNSSYFSVLETANDGFT